MVDYFTTIAEQTGIPIWLFLIIFAWSYIWKLFALWKSARNKSVIWFVLLAIINTVGILEILYIFVFSKIQCCQFALSKKVQKKKVSKPKRK